MQKLLNNVTNTTSKQDKNSNVADSGDHAHQTIEYKFALLRGGAVKLSDALRAARPDLKTDIVLGSPLLPVAHEEKDKKSKKRD